jgi:hypothetical protein
MDRMTTSEPNSRQLSPAVPPAAPPAGRPAPPSSEPRKPRGVLATIFSVFVAIVSAIYLINPTLGVFELLPDNIPLVGNLDEAFFTLALVSALGALGLRLPFLPRR